MELFGYYFPPEIINWFCDDWYNNIYKKINHFYPLYNHYCENIGGKPRYNINNQLIMSNQQLRKSCQVMNLKCNEIVEKDYKRIKDKI